jgi:hypothetical protein
LELQLKASQGLVEQLTIRVWIAPDGHVLQVGKDSLEAPNKPGGMGISNCAFILWQRKCV